MNVCLSCCLDVCLSELFNLFLSVCLSVPPSVSLSFFFTFFIWLSLPFFPFPALPSPSQRQAGFAYLECGAVRSKNATNILIKNLLDAVIGALSYWLFGYAFAYGDGDYTNPFIGYRYFAGDGMEASWSGWFFQFVFAATAATIVSGAVAERCSFTAYFAYSLFITGLVCTEFPLNKAVYTGGQGQ